MYASLFQDVCSRSPSIISLKTGERFIMELKKSGGSLGISVAVSGLSLCFPDPLIHPAIIKIKMLLIRHRSFLCRKGGINTNVRYGGIYIKSLVPGGAAEQDGRIQIGNCFYLSSQCAIRWLLNT